MNTAVADHVLHETTHCHHKFSCLKSGHCGDRELCPVDCADGHNVLVLATKRHPVCPYRFYFGDDVICLCPTHYALHANKPGSERERSQRVVHEINREHGFVPSPGLE